MKDSKLLFYEIMNYPVPNNSKIFEYGTKTQDLVYKKNDDFSRKEKNQHIDEFIKKINKFGNLYRSLPFISEIFLCNSISFNSIKEDSDIDIFIITKKSKLRRARFFSELYFTILGQKRFKKNKKQKFCLSFYIAENNKNLYSIMIDRSDIYLGYRLAHLIPLYQEVKEEGSMYKKNPWFEAMFPNHPQKYCINIGTELFTGKSIFKIIIEFLFGGVFGRLIEKIIKFIRTPILKYKTRKLGEKGKGIVINDQMLKFYDDQRIKISTLFNISQKG